MAKGKRDLSDATRRVLCCPWCARPGVHMIMERRVFESRLAGADDLPEHIDGPQVRWRCGVCGFGEVAVVPPLEHREAKGEP